jgi:hypothetical protein
MDYGILLKEKLAREKDSMQKSFLLYQTGQYPEIIVW